MLYLLKDFMECESGASAVEYAVLAGMVALGIVGALVGLGTSTPGSLGSVSSAMQTIEWT